jgi:phospholipid-binding lipoprotein MlaA
MKQLHLFPRSTLRLFFAVIVVCITSAGCATAPRAGGEPNDDPLEPFNRKVFYANRVIDGVIIRPAAEAYRGLVPYFVQDRFRNVLNNLTEPRILANNLLQGRWSAAGTTFSRFVLNSTAGVAGLFDIATKEGLARQSGDFGQTLHGWGFGEGIYLVLPLFGPSNVRDAIGLGVDIYSTAPGPYLPNSSSDAVTAVRVADGVDLRSRNIEALDVIEQSSLDFYAQLKSIVRQRRQVTLREVRPVKDDPANDDLRDPLAPPTPDAPPAKDKTGAAADAEPPLDLQAADDTTASEPERDQPPDSSLSARARNER